MEELIVNGKVLKEAVIGPASVPEATVTFKTITERGIYEVRSEKVDQPIFEISGYGLKVNFNMQYLNSLEDIENCLEGIKELFRDIILEQLIENKKRLEES